MPKLPDNGPFEEVGLQGKSVEELLLLVADDDYGLKEDAAEILLEMGFKRIYPILEKWVRSDDNADLRNSSMEMLVRFGSESVPHLITLLQDSNEEVRNFAAVMLGDIGNRQPVGALIQALSDNDANVSHSAAEALGKIGDRAALFPLIELLKGDFWVQYAAIAAIGAMRDYRAVPHLLQILDNEFLAGPAIDALGEIGDPRALYPLGRLLPQTDTMLAGQIARAMMLIYKSVKDALCFKNSLAEYQQPEHMKNVINQQGIEKLHMLLENSRETETVAAAVILLGWLEDLKALPLFFRILENEIFIVPVESAIFSIGRAATPSLIAALSVENDNAKIVALRSLRNFGVLDESADLKPLLASTNDALQMEALEAAQFCPHSSLLATLLEIFADRSAYVHYKAAEVLGRYPFHMLQNFLESVVNSSDREKRMLGAQLLCHVKEDGDGRLLSALARDTDPEVRKTALKAVGIQRAEVAIPLLSAALTDPDITVRETAVMALADFRTPTLVDEVAQLLGSDGESLDYAVVKALGMMKANSAETSLLKFLERGDLSRKLEYVLIETLGKISAKTASAIISNRYLQHADADVRRLAVETLGQLVDGNSIQAVETALQDPHWSVRVAALHVLGKLGGIKELPLVLEAVSDPDTMVKKHAILILGDLRNVSAIPVLIQQLTDNEVGKHAFVALLKFGRSALPWLHRQMMRPYSVEVRVLLIDLIGKIGDQKSVTPLIELLDDHNPAIRLATIDSLAFCFDSLLLKKLSYLQNNDEDEEVKNRADLALKTFTMEKYN
jgi:HEAT repeat protein